MALDITVRPRRTNDSPTYRFPANVAESGNFMMLHRYAYRRPSLSAPANANKLGTYVLPLPSDLTFSYNMDYNTGERLGLAGTGAAEIVKKMQESGDNSIMGAFNAGKSYMSGIIGSATGNATGASKDILAYMALDSDNLGNGVVGNIRQGLSSALGFARNPFLAVLFNNPEFRKFDWSWKLVARSRAEATAIENIVKEIKIGMHPTRYNSTGSDITLLFKYPDLFQVEFPADKKIPKIASLVITSATMNYHGDSGVFWHDDGQPVIITLNIQASECVILTSEEIRNGF